jgi:D-tyrosyl-tRNA(Tyr) deacylase
MKVVIQRVSSASVTIDGQETARIGRGLLIFVGIEAADDAGDGEWLAQKIARLRIFDDTEGKMNLSLLDLAPQNRDEWRASSADASRAASTLQRQNSQLSTAPAPGAATALVISQFTLHASMAKGTRPSFNAAAKPEHAKPLYELFIKQLEKAIGRPVATGVFGAMMEIGISNHGPVTLIQDSKHRV